MGSLSPKTREYKLNFTNLACGLSSCYRCNWNGNKYGFDSVFFPIQKYDGKNLKIKFIRNWSNAGRAQRYNDGTFGITELQENKF